VREAYLKPARTEFVFEALPLLGVAAPQGEARFRWVERRLASSIRHEDIEETG
jgi:hypothetical protein